MSVNRVGFICVAASDGQPRIVQRMLADVRCGAVTYEQFTKMVKDIKQQIKEKNAAAESVLVIRPALLDQVKDMEKWLSTSKAAFERRIGTCCIVRNEDDPSFEWPVFTHGYDIADERHRPLMIESCKKISLARMSGMQGHGYIRDDEVYTFASVDSPVWTDNLLKLCEKEEVFAASPENYMYFMEAK